MSAAPSRMPWWLIASCVVMILTAIAHTLAQSQPPQLDTAEMKELFRQMETVKIPLPGHARTAMELNHGFGWLMSGACAGLGVLGLMMIGQPAGARRRVTLVIAVIMAFYTLIGALFFFVIPLGCFGTAFVLAGLSLLLDPK